VRADALHTTEQQFDASFDVNVKGAFALSQTVARHMLAQPEREGRHASIVNIVDEGAYLPSPAYAAHGLGKAALLAMTRLHAVAFGPRVRVNAVCPGPVLKPDEMPEARWQALRVQNPLNALGTARQVAECVLFLVAGPQFVNGDCIMLDGGARWKRT
jgi:NAD(P)-dependent dehydrogenase (short-subunit alcohol dehydrogenase family)